MKATKMLQERLIRCCWAFLAHAQQSRCRCRGLRHHGGHGRRQFATRAAWPHGGGGGGKAQVLHMPNGFEFICGPGNTIIPDLRLSSNIVNKINELPTDVLAKIVTKDMESSIYAYMNSLKYKAEFELSGISQSTK